MDKNINSIKSFSERIQIKYGVETLAIQVDITKEREVKEALKKIIKKQKKLMV